VFSCRSLLFTTVSNIPKVRFFIKKFYQNYNKFLEINFNKQSTSIFKVKAKPTKNQQQKNEKFRKSIQKKIKQIYFTTLSLPQKSQPPNIKYKKRANLEILMIKKN